MALSLKAFLKALLSIPLCKSPVHAHIRNLLSRAPKRPCHYHQLFVRNDGYIFPCCDSRLLEYMKIGHVADNDLQRKMAAFDRRCSCDRYRFIKAKRQTEIMCQHLNVELALTCQARCIMCCVKAPEWQGNYEYYLELSGLVDRLSPVELFVQGGEVLIQKQAVSWLKRIKAAHPAITISVATNGNIDESDLTDGLIDRFSVSFVGFQNETYRKIMGLDIDKTMRFVEALQKNNSCQLQLKYLITPINMHELGLFLKWAISLSPERILIADASTRSYIRLDTDDHYWQKIIDRVGTDMKEQLSFAKETIVENNIVVAMQRKLRILFGIDDKFLKSEGLNSNVITHVGWPRSSVRMGAKVYIHD